MRAVCTQTAPRLSCVKRPHSAANPWAGFVLPVIAPAKRGAAGSLLPLIPQGYIDAGLVEYEHFTQVQHPSGKPQMHAYDG